MRILRGFLWVERVGVMLPGYCGREQGSGVLVMIVRFLGEIACKYRNQKSEISGQWSVISGRW